MDLLDTEHTPYRISTEALMARSDRTSWSLAAMRAGLAARVVERMLDRISIGRLTVVDHTTGTTTHHGASAVTATGANATDPYEATMEIHDHRAWTAVLAEGSIGFGRGYIEGWWTSPDPVAVIRLVIANIRPVDEIRNRISRVVAPVSDRIRRVLPRSGRQGNKEQISAHYDLGNHFFALFLDETMTYSSAVFPRPDATLEEASLHKYDMVIDALGLNEDHHLLEIGTGWGGMAIRAAERTGCRVTTTTISDEQLRLARKRIADAGLTDRVTVIDSDWRDLSGSYDRVVSVEMIEAVDWRDYRRFFSTIEACLKPDGVAVLQAICVPDRRYQRTKNTEDFIARFVFPGGYLPSIGAVLDAVSSATRLQLVALNDFSAHYAETLRRWRERFEEHQADLDGLGLDERFHRLWRFYLCYCEAGFLERHCTVNHISLVGAEWRPSLSRVPTVAR
ncbi:MAG: cyclopropane-fatty-acyl-phospholipid synthase family protein [Acidimicrobiia bacterium]|nr:cyclopropane-fatty-acyl-phospholipid synthase family protein [Acidimicrobiia bacterium]